MGERTSANYAEGARCDHKWDVLRDACVRCGLTRSLIAAGRDRPADWTDVDAAYAEGFNVGYSFADAHWRHDGRKRFFRLGARWVLRELRVRDEAQFAERASQDFQVVGRGGSS